MARAIKQRKPRITSAGNISSTFGLIKVEGDFDKHDLQRNIMAISWIDEIVEDSNGALEYENTSTGVVVAAHMGKVKILVDVRLCAERFLSECYWTHGHVPAFVNSSELCIEMGSGYTHNVPDLDLCAALLMLLSSQDVPIEMYPSTLYQFFPFKELQGMLSDKNENVVKNTLSAMGQLECAASLRQLQKALYQSPNEVFVMTAMEALFYGRDFNMKQFMPLLVELTNSNHIDCKVRAIHMLGLILDSTQTEYMHVLRRVIRFDHHCVLGPVLDTYILMAQEEALPDCLYLLENRKPYWHSEVVRRLCEIDHPLVKQALSVRYLTHSTSAEERALIECYLNANCKDTTEQKVNDYILSRLVLNASEKPSEDDDPFSGLGSLFG
ncbi:hypothetical protein N9N26_04215 [Candidatus Poseidoniales archaeon]|nr:hypothetical protein [Candidatus Poseidoniales archaeon]